MGFLKRVRRPVSVEWFGATRATALGARARTSLDVLAGRGGARAG